MRRYLWQFGVVLTMIMAACGLGITGVDSLGEAIGSADAGGGDGGERGERGEDAGSTDAGVGDTAAPPTDACAAAPGDDAAIAAVTQPITIDGHLSEWGCARFYEFDAARAALVVGPATIPNRYSFALAWDPDFLYAAVIAVDPQLVGATVPDIYNNDSFELYVGGAAALAGEYTAADHQWVIDWGNRARVYQNLVGSDPGPGFTWMVRPSSNGFTAEMRIAASEVGRSALAAQVKLGIAFAASNSNGTTQETWMLWRRAPVACDTGCCQAACDTRFLEPFVLAP